MISLETGIITVVLPFSCNISLPNRSDQEFSNVFNLWILLLLWMERQTLCVCQCCELHCGVDEDPFLSHFLQTFWIAGSLLVLMLPRTALGARVATAAQCLCSCRPLVSGLKDHSFCWLLCIRLTWIHVHLWTPKCTWQLGPWFLDCCWKQNLGSWIIKVIFGGFPQVIISSVSVWENETILNFKPSYGLTINQKI